MREMRAATKHVATERAEHVDHAVKALPGMDQARYARADISSLEERVAEVRKETEIVKAAHEAGESYICGVFGEVNLSKSSGAYHEIESLDYNSTLAIDSREGSSSTIAFVVITIFPLSTFSNKRVSRPYACRTCRGASGSL